jgi:hypothetical protein
MAQAYVSTGSSIVSTTAVAAFLEVAYKQQAAEKALSTPQNLVGIQIDDDAGTARITATIPGTLIPKTTPRLLLRLGLAKSNLRGCQALY